MTGRGFVCKVWILLSEEREEGSKILRFFTRLSGKWGNAGGADTIDSFKAQKILKLVKSKKRVDAEFSQPFI